MRPRASAAWRNGPSAIEASGIESRATAVGDADDLERKPIVGAEVVGFQG